MKRLTCEMCGSTDLIKMEGVFVCQSCGCKYTVEEAKKMMIEGTVEVTGTVKVDNSDAIDSYLKIAKNAIESNNNEEAENYANKIIEIEPTNSSAWLIKGEASGWQSKANNDRIEEAVKAWLNAIKFAEESKINEIRSTVAGKYALLFVAMVSLRTGNFSCVQSGENLQAALNEVHHGIELMNDLTVKGGVSFNRAAILDAIAGKLKDGGVNGFQDARKDFGPDHSRMAKWQWDNFVAAGDNCVSMLEKAVLFVRNETLGLSICSSMINIAETVRDSKSWTFNVNSYTYDHYVEDYSFTNDAKRMRSKNIEKYKSLRNEFQPNRKQKVLNAIRYSRIEKETVLAKELYWEEHSSEKSSLDSEREDLLAKIESLKATINNNPKAALLKNNKQKVTDIAREISSLSARMNRLGVFKNKEKRTIQLQMDELERQKSETQSVVDNLEIDVRTSEDSLKQELDTDQNRLTEIVSELSKERGRISAERPQAFQNVLEDGKFTVSCRAFMERLEDILPEPYRLNEQSLGGFGMQEDMSDFISVGIIDSSVTGDNKNTGIIFTLEAKDLDEPIASLSISYRGRLTLSSAEKLALFCSLTVLLFEENITQERAESLATDVLYDDKNSRFAIEHIIVEYVSYKGILYDVVPEYESAVLIRPYVEE